MTLGVELLHFQQSVKPNMYIGKLPKVLGHGQRQILIVWHSKKNKNKILILSGVLARLLNQN